MYNSNDLRLFMISVNYTFVFTKYKCVWLLQKEQVFSLLKSVFNIDDYPTFLRIKGKRNSLQRAHILDNLRFKDSALL